MSHQHSDIHTHTHTVTPKRTYFAVFGALLVLTAATVLVASFDLGVLNNIVALGIAGCKASIVVYFFMEVRKASALTKLTAVTGLVWLVILLMFTMSDYFSRGWIPIPRPW